MYITLHSIYKYIRFHTYLIKKLALSNLIILVSGIPLENYHYDYCVTSHTVHGHNYIDMISNSLGVALGGNGRTAKCADEVGYIAARY